MDGRFPKRVTPGYADGSPLSFPIRRWVDRPDATGTLATDRSRQPNLSIYSDGPSDSQLVRAPHDEAHAQPRPRNSPRASVVRRKQTFNVLFFYGYPLELIALWCGVSKQTAALYKNGSRKPSRQALRLFVLHRDGRVLGPEWREWSVRKDKLVSPEGAETTHGQLNAYAIVMQLAFEVTRNDPEKYAELNRLLQSA